MQNPSLRRSAAEPPSPWCDVQMDFQAIETETDCIRLLGLDTPAQGQRHLSRRHVTKNA